MTARPVTLVTLSGFPDVFERLARSVDRHETAGLRKLVVASGPPRVWWPGWTVVPGVEPFVFARNANRGIAAAGTDDVVLINDDCELLMPLVDPLRAMAYAQPPVGILSPQIEDGGGDASRAARVAPVQRRDSPTRLAFVCVYLPRATIDAVGGLDERFTGYGYEDDDFCLRVARAGRSLSVTEGVCVRHGFPGIPFSTSYARVMPPEDRHASLEAMRRLFEAKYQGGAVDPAGRARW